MKHRFLFYAVLLILSTAAKTSAQTHVAYPGTYLKNKLAKGKTLSPAEQRRFADLGRCWGVLHYFNPALNSGSVVTDSVALQSLRLLLSDPSANGFEKAIKQMLAVAADPGTQVVEKAASTPSLIFSQEKAPPKVFTLPDSMLFIAFPTRSADYIEDPAAISGLMPSEWSNAKAIIIDIRNATPSASYAEYTFLYDVMPMIMKAIAGDKKLPAIYERRVYHSGFVSQSSSNPNIYNSGFQVVAGPPSATSTAKALGKPVAFIYNRYTDIELLKQLWVLRAAGLCKLIYEGAAGSATIGNTEQLIFADSLTVQIRINEYQLSGNQPVPSPDLLVDRIRDTSLTGAFVQQAITLLKDTQKKETISTGAGTDFIQPRPGRYADTLVPSTAQRLFGLFNFWNAIQYFSPYKEGLDHSWDAVLYKYVPIFLNADDSLSYMLAIRSLASETQDCHGFVGTSRAATPARKFYGAWPPVQVAYIGHKVYITEITKDSSQDLSKLHPGDEVTHIDGRPVKELADEWRDYIPTSNENTYERDAANYFLVGPLNSSFSVTIRRGQRSEVIALKRNGRWNMGRGILDFNNKHKAAEMLGGNIGYINMGSLKQSAVDSVMRAFQHTGTIIFDIRNYPQGTAWSIAPKLTDTIKKAVLFDKPLVDYNYLRGGEDQSSLKSAFTVIPEGKTPYKGKVIILCDRTTQSQAEYTIMMFQGATHCTVIGSQTAGADGNVTEVTLPGGYTISFSGLGIYYPDGTPTQRKGIKVDIKSEPTIAGLLAGKDEVLERAIQFVRSGK